MRGVLEMRDDEAVCQSSFLAAFCAAKVARNEERITWLYAMRRHYT